MAEHPLRAAFELPVIIAAALILAILAAFTVLGIAAFLADALTEDPIAYLDDAADETEEEVNADV